MANRPATLPKRCSRVKLRGKLSIATFTIMSRRARRAAPVSGGGATVKGLGIGLLVALPVAAVTYVLASLVSGLQCFN